MREEILQEEQSVAEEQLAATRPETRLLRQRLQDLPAHQPAITVERHATVREATNLMLHHQVEGVLIIDQEQVVGVCTRSQVLTRLVVDALDMDQVRVEEIMRLEPVCLQPEHQLTSALHQMYVGEHSLVPLTDEQGRPLGIISMRDIVRYLVETFPQEVQNLPPTPAHALPQKPEGA
jgi:predicted transcriptional regulator